MRIGIPRVEGQLDAWRESITEAVNTIPESIQSRTTTTDATPTVLLSVPMPANAIYAFDWVLMARQTAGSGGTVGNGATYRGLESWHLVSGSATEIGSGPSLMAVEDDATWAVSVAGSGNRVEWSVTGAANQVIGWRVDVSVRQLTI